MDHLHVLTDQSYSVGSYKVERLLQLLFVDACQSFVDESAFFIIQAEVILESTDDLTYVVQCRWLSEFIEYPFERLVGLVRGVYRRSGEPAQSLESTSSLILVANLPRFIAVDVRGPRKVSVADCSDSRRYCTRHEQRDRVQRVQAVIIGLGDCPGARVDPHCSVFTKVGDRRVVR